MNRLREHREAAGMTLQALAEAVGSRKAYIWQLENKLDPDPGVKLAFSISRVLSVPVDQIFDVSRPKERIES